MNINKQLAILAGFILVTFYILYIRAFQEDNPTCDNYVTNTYLYIALGILISAFSVLFMEKRKYPITGTKMLIFFVISITALISLLMIDNKNVLMSHILWLVFIITLSVGPYVRLKNSQYGERFLSTLIITFVLVIILSTISYLRPDWIGENLGGILTIGLIGGIVAIIAPALCLTGKLSNYYSILSGLFVFLFMGFILYDTKKLRERAQTCIIPNYPKESVNIFLDIANLFMNINNLG